MKIKCGILVALIMMCSLCYAYTDMTSSHWAYSDLMTLSDQGIVSGYPDGSFQPDRHITKAEFMSLLQKSLFANADVSSVSGKWYDGLYNFFNGNNLLNPYAFQKDKLERDITRFEVAEAFVYCFPVAKQAYLEEEYIGKNLFSDTIGEREKKIAVIMAETDIFNGYPDGTIRWGSSVTRAEMVCIITNVLKNREKLEQFRLERAEPIYEDNYVISTDISKYCELQPYQYADDECTVITKLKSVELADGLEDVSEKYKYIFEKLDCDLPDYSLKKKNVEANKLIIVDFETINRSDEYSVSTGANYLRLAFPGREDIRIIDSFDTDEFLYIDKNMATERVSVDPESSYTTTAVYVVNDLPNKIRFHRDVTTMYNDNEYLHTSSFQALTVYL